jgi:hypothetical protein
MFEKSGAWAGREIGSRHWGLTRLAGRALLLAGLTLLGCGNTDASNCSGAAQVQGLGCAEAAVTQCLARQTQVTSGVYGCVTSSDDVGEPKPAKAFPEFRLEVFEAERPPTPGDGLTPVAATTSDRTGFFELGLEPGAHWLCTSFLRCIRVELAAGSPQPHNYDFGPGQGFW